MTVACSQEFRGLLLRSRSVASVTRATSASPAAPGSGTAIASDESGPAAIALALPVVPSTDPGGLAAPKESSPQQTTALVPDWIAQLWRPPPAIALALPVLPLTDAGGLA